MLSALRITFSPYFILNLIACFAYIGSKYIPWVCRHAYETGEKCALDWRDQEILMFLCFVIVIKNRRWKPSQWTEYMANVFMLVKGTNIVLFFRKSTALGIVYIITCLILFLLVPEPKYKGPEEVRYFRGQALEEEIAQNKGTVYLIEFYASWSSACNHFTPVFAEISLNYNHEYLKFGKLDVGRYPIVAERYNIDTTVRSKQLPTLILFVNGEEKLRRPAAGESQISWYYRFTKENIIQDFCLNEHYNASKEKAKRKGITSEEKPKKD